MVAPLVLAVAVMLTLLILVILPGGAGVRRPGADVSLILLLLPTLLVGVIVLAVLGGLIFVLALGILRLPPYFKIGQDYVALAAAYVQGGAKRVSDSVLLTRAGVAAVQRVLADLQAAFTVQRRD